MVYNRKDMFLTCLLINPLACCLCELVPLNATIFCGSETVKFMGVFISLRILLIAYGDKINLFLTLLAIPLTLYCNNRKINQLHYFIASTGDANKCNISDLKKRGKNLFHLELLFLVKKCTQIMKCISQNFP